LSGTVVLREKWPVIGRHEQAATWLQIWTDLGRAPRTIDAYARGLGEYLLMCEREGVDPVAANRAHVAVFVRELMSRPSLRGANVVAIDSGAGLAAGRAERSAAWCRGWPGCRGSRASRSGCGCWRRPAASRRATA
jgi:hypothetical protein